MRWEKRFLMIKNCDIKIAWGKCILFFLQKKQNYRSLVNCTKVTSHKQLQEIVWWFFTHYGKTYLERIKTEYWMKTGILLWRNLRTLPKAVKANLINCSHNEKKSSFFSSVSFLYCCTIDKMMKEDEIMSFFLSSVVSQIVVNR